MEKSDALLKAQEALLEAIKSGALPKFGAAEADKLSKFIADAHKELMDYYERVEL